MEYWNIPKIWKGETVLVLGGGPTLLKCLKGKEFWHNRVLGVNSAFLLGDWVDVCWFGDPKWYWWYKDEMRMFTGLKITCNRHPELCPSVEDEPGVKIVKYRLGKGLNQKRDCVAWNRSSGASAINVAYLLGAKKILLLGFDMKRVKGRKNWSPHIEEFTKPNPYKNFLEPFPDICMAAERLGIEIFNLTPGSALKVFPFANLSDFPELI